ncbi:MAG: tyrosine-type recombinase/integrase [Planctomycetota bacterium JB042]
MRIRDSKPPLIEWKEFVDGRWVGRSMTVSPRNLRRFGLRAPGSPKGITRRHAERLKDAVERALQLAEEHGLDGPLVPLSHVIDTHLETLRCSANYRRRRERALKSPAKDDDVPHLKAKDISLLTFTGDVPIRSVTSEQLLRYQNMLEDHGYAPMSVRGFLRDVRALFNFAVRHGYLERSPADTLRMPPNEPADGVYFLTMKQVKKLLDLAGDPLKYDPTLRFRLEKEKEGRRTFLPSIGNNVISQVLPGFLYLGVRRSELCRIRWKDVDLMRKVAVIHGARKNPNRRERTRVVPIPDQLLDYLKRKPRDSEFVFTNSEGEPWTPHSLSSCLRHFQQTYAKRLGFHVDFQTLRRTYGSLLYQAGYPLDQVAEFLGHSDVNTTRTWYACLRAEDHGARVTKAFEIAARGAGKAGRGGRAAPRSRR